jgi:hypothetical protein
MGLERRGRADQGQPVANPRGEEPGAGPGPRVKSFEIDKRLIMEAWEKVRADNGAPGVDAVSTGLFEEQLKGSLCKLWNRMSSGCYFPGPVRGVEMPACDPAYAERANRRAGTRTTDTAAMTLVFGDLALSTCVESVPTQRAERPYAAHILLMWTRSASRA